MYRSLLSELRALVSTRRYAGGSVLGDAVPLDLRPTRRRRRQDFDDVVFDYGIGQGIRWWLSPLTSKATGTEINISGVGRRGGEFIAGELERAADDSATVSAACDEIVARGADRRSLLVFCCGVAHAHHVCEALRARGISCRVVTGETPLPERADSIAMFKAGIFRPGQHQRVDDRLRCAEDRPPRHVAADAVDRTLRANGRPRHSQG